MNGIGDMTPEEAAAMEAEGAPLIAEQQAAAAAGNVDGNAGVTPDYKANAATQAFNTIDELFPPGWGSEGETPEGTTWNNAAEGLWLPLILPDTTEGPWGNFALKPYGIFYADTRTGVVANTQTAHCGEAHASPEVDQCRVDVASRFALDAASTVGGTGAGVRELS